MATVSSTFTATGVSSNLFVADKAEEISLSLSGTYAATVELQRSSNPSSGFETVSTHSTANATVALDFPNDRPNQYWRLLCRSYTSGTVTYSISDGDAILEEFKDEFGNVKMTYTQAGVSFPGTMAVTGTTALTGTVTTSGALNPGGNVDIGGTLDVTGAVTTDSTVNMSAGAVTLGTVAGTPTFSGNVTFGADMLTTTNVGTANTGVTAIEEGNGSKHVTKLTISQADAFDIADNAALADGYLIYTFPAGNCIITNAYMSVGVTTAEAVSQTDTPDVGLGTVIATGAVATLDGTPTFEDIITGQTAADANGTATVAAAAPEFLIKTGDAHTLHVNIADTWADDTGADLTTDLAGTVVIEWTFLD